MFARVNWKLYLCKMWMIALSGQIFRPFLTYLSPTKLQKKSKRIKGWLCSFIWPLFFLGGLIKEGWGLKHNKKNLLKRKSYEKVSEKINLFSFIYETVVNREGRVVYIECIEWSIFLALFDLFITQKTAKICTLIWPLFFGGLIKEGWGLKYNIFF